MYVHVCMYDYMQAQQRRLPIASLPTYDWQVISEEPFAHDVDDLLHNPPLEVHCAPQRIATSFVSTYI